MGLFTKRERTPVATVEVSLFNANEMSLSAWVDEGDRQETNYHAILHYMMYYARLLFFLSYRDAAYELVEQMDKAVLALAEAEPDAPVTVIKGWTSVAAGHGEPRAVWSSTLSLVGPGEYRCADVKPKDPEDTDAQTVALLCMQHLIDSLPALERAYLALGITGMHEYYRDIQLWANSKSLHPAPTYGMSKARQVLEKP